MVPLRTLLVEDNKPFLDYVSSVVREHPDLEIVGEAHNGVDAVERATALKPDLIILDIGLPGMNGIEAARQIRKLVPIAKIIFLTQESSPEIVSEAFRLGAWGYVLKCSAAHDLEAAIQGVIDGNRFVSEALKARPIAAD